MNSQIVRESGSRLSLAEARLEEYEKGYKAGLLVGRLRTFVIMRILGDRWMGWNPKRSQIESNLNRLRGRCEKFVALSLFIRENVHGSLRLDGKCTVLFLIEDLQVLIDRGRASPKLVTPVRAKIVLEAFPMFADIYIDFQKGTGTITGELPTVA